MGLIKNVRRIMNVTSQKIFYAKTVYASVKTQAYIGTKNQFLVVWFNFIKINQDLLNIIKNSSA